MRNLIFISAGGRGTRLWDVISVLKEKHLPKSLGLEVNGEPLLFYQLRLLAKLLDTDFVICFNDKTEVDLFKNLVKEKNLPPFNYTFTYNTYHPDNTSLDIMKTSNDRSFLNKDYGQIIILSGDVYFEEDLIPVLQHQGRNTLILSDYSARNSKLKKNILVIYKNNRLQHLKTSRFYPREIISHPLVLTKEAFDLYKQLPLRTSKYAFINYALATGVEFEVLKPSRYVNLNTPDDIRKLQKLGVKVNGVA